MFGFMMGARSEKLSSKELERRRLLLQNIVKVHLGMIIFLGPVACLLFSLSLNSNLLLLIVPLVIGAICAAISWQGAAHGMFKGAAFLEIAATVLLITYLNLLIKADGMFNLCYIWALVLAALLLDGLSTLLWGLVVLILAGFGVFVQLIIKVWPPFVSLDSEVLAALQLLVGVSMVVLITISLILLANGLNQAVVQAETEAKNAVEAGKQISYREQAGYKVGEEVNKLAVTLALTSRQQASGAQEQVAAVVEVTTSLEELSETARQIAANADSVAEAASNALETATKLQQTSEQAGNTSERGQLAVESAIMAIEVVRNRIEVLGQRLLNLTERSKQINSIIDLISEIADETHLLALNAAIESAGVGETGRRFGVIAQEVKSLADRSLEATEDVRQVIVEVQGAVAAAVLAAEEGKKETGRAVERSYQAGLVISEMGQVVVEASHESQQIVEAVKSVNVLCEEISFATRQQQSASGQIVTTMRSISEVAQETASASHEIIQTVEELRTLSGQLNQTLAV